MVKALLLSLLGGFYYFSGISPTPPVTTHSEQPIISGCDLPAPKNVKVLATGGGFFDIGWDAVPEAAFFHVSVYKDTNDSLAGAVIVPALPANNHAVVDGLEAGKSYYLYVYSVCSNGILSPKQF